MSSMSSVRYTSRDLEELAKAARKRSAAVGSELGWEQTLAAGRRIDLRTYFRGIGQPNLAGLARNELEWDWDRTPIEWVPFHRLWATQKWITREGLRHHRRPGARPDSRRLPFVVHRGGRFWLRDGHHRAVNAVDRGETHLQAHVRRLRES